ncbi:MAG: hypothetical protein ACREOW_16285 [Thermodesulfobacteriota bacterium]
MPFNYKNVVGATLACGEPRRATVAQNNRAGARPAPTVAQKIVRGARPFG